jgi:hypothetical protein
MRRSLIGEKARIAISKNAIAPSPSDMSDRLIGLKGFKSLQDLGFGQLMEISAINGLCTMFCRGLQA